MIKKSNATGQPAGTGNLYPSASQIALLIPVVVLALQDFHAQETVDATHNEYLFGLTDFESKHGRTEGGRIDPLNPDHAAIIAATKIQYDGYQLAKRKAYNARRRLQTACRKAAHLNAERAAGAIQ
jgi:hypothetical protein